MVQPPSHPVASHTNNDVQLRAATNETLQYLASRVGELVEAKVIKVTHQLVNDKAALEKSLTDRSLTDKPVTNKPENKQAMDLSGRSKSTSVKAAVELNPNRYEVLMNVGGNKTLNVQSPLAPRIGQILQLQVLSHQQVEIVGIRTGVIEQVLSSTSQNAVAAQQAALRSNSQSVQAQANATKALTAKSLATLQSALRANLPKQVAKESLLTTLDTLTRQQSLLPTALQSAISKLQKSINPLQQLTQANGLARAMHNSGLLYEAKLAHLIAAARSKGIALSNPAIKTLADTLGINTSLAQGVSATNTGTVNTSNTKGQYRPSNIDHKQAILQLITALKSSLLSSSIASNKTVNPALQNNATLSSLWSLVANASIADAALKTASGDNNEQLLQLLRLALTVITRTQSQQLFTANTQLLTSNDNVANQSWSLELPVWVEQKLNLIDIHIEADKDNEPLTKSGDKAWNARLSFDLEAHGNMVAFATLRGKTIAAVLWVTEASTVDKVNRELAAMAENLDRLGLQVERLQCRVGEPEDVRANGTINLLDNLLDTEV
ncbi:flagellar hook-length control protein FliK [Pseudomonadales bacterium]|nr:flagellar hook-length control protein FliK [Pseudomonadales bacterium]